MESALINPIKYIEEIYKRPFMCAGFARRYSEIIITKNAEDKKDEVYHRASAWNFQYHNRKIWSKEDGIFNPSILREGMILAIRLPHSIFNRRRDERGNPARNTHMAAFKGIRKGNYGMEYIISHNVGGTILCEDIFDFLQRNEAFVADVFSPGEEGLRAAVLDKI